MTRMSCVKSSQEEQMKDTRLLRFAVAVCASTMMASTLPALAHAQQQPSGSQAPVGVETKPGPAPMPIQLPRTGNPEADASNSLPGVLIGGGALVALLALRRDWVRETLRRRRQ